MLRRTNLNIGFVLLANLQLVSEHRALRRGKTLRWIGISLFSTHKKNPRKFLSSDLRFLE
jgi:hypothetical protein